ncbi:hypothetical protein BJ165DRAFT_1356524 [Panaeolus papilionaceus]|nr:hypothetical protein BJ165DRAFT_1356524 [Panaeolus papilionaceus]
MRHEQLFGEDGDLSSGANVYLAAAYLHPHYIHSDIFLDIDNSVVGLDMQGIRHASLYRTVATILARIAGNEILHGAQPEFTRWRGHASVFKERLRNQLKTYARRQYPFNQPLNLEHDGIVEWWTRLDGQTDTDVLPLAIKIHTVRVNSMPEERTASTFTWLTPALRARMKIGQISARAVINQFYKTEKTVSALCNCVGISSTY